MKYEYRMISASGVLLETSCFALGKEGWELVSVVCTQGNYVMGYFKREISPMDNECSLMPQTVEQVRLLLQGRIDHQDKIIGELKLTLDKCLLTACYGLEENIDATRDSLEAVRKLASTALKSD